MPAMRYLRLSFLVLVLLGSVEHAWGQAPAANRPPHSYAGPGAGMATWTGKIGKDETLTIQNGTPSSGTLSGAGLPGVPVRLVIDQTNLGIAEMPNAANGYRRLVLKSYSRHEKIVIHWTVIQ